MVDLLTWVVLIVLVLALQEVSETGELCKGNCSNQAHCCDRFAISSSVRIRVRLASF